MDPIIEINCLDSKKYSTSKKAIGPTGIVHWGEHIFFEPKKLVSFIQIWLGCKDITEVEEGRLVIKILNKGFLKDDLIGIYELELTQIYFRDQHSMIHKWLAFSNPEGKDFNEITCYMKISINIAAAGDDQV